MMNKTFCLIAFLFSAGILKSESPTEQVGLYGYDDSLDLYVPKGNISGASKIEEPAENTGKWITVISREDIERNGDITVLEAIRNYPGLHIVPKGPFGGNTEVHIRGGKAGHILVLIDGVKVNNPVSTDRSFDWGTLSTSAIERIEIIRGPQCALYGSDAMGGVINIVTKKGTGGVKTDGALWVRPYNTLAGQVGVSGGTSKFDYSTSLFNISSRGISKTVSPADSQPAEEKDGYKNSEIYTKMNIYPFNNLSIGLNTAFRKSQVDMDAGPFRDDSNNVNRFTAHQSDLFINQNLSGLWNYKLNFGINNIEGADTNKPDAFDTTDSYASYEGEYINAGWQNNFNINRSLRIIAGFEAARESGESCNCERNPPDTGKMRFSRLSNRSAYVEIMPSYKKFSLALNGRIDDYYEFGNYKTWQASLGWLVNSTKIKANYGIGFKMPSLHQLFNSNYGNSKLIPEKNHSFDVGGEHRFKDGVIEITYYQQQIANSINLVDGKYRNRGEGNIWCTEGMEIYYLVYITKDVSTDISFTGLDKIDAPQNYLLLPSLDYRWGITYKWLSVKFCCIGKRQDNDYIGNLGDIIDIRSCAHIDITNSFIIKGLKIRLKIENLIDDKSMESYGYTSTGRGFSISIGY